MDYELNEEREEIVVKLKKPGKKAIIIAGIIIFVLILAASGFFIHDKLGRNVKYTVLSESDYPQQIGSQVIPEYKALERALACVVDDKIYVIASRGEKPTPGYEISIKKMNVTEKDGVKTLAVYTEFKDPGHGENLTQVLTYPLQVAETDLTYLPDQIELKVKYVD